VDLRLVRVVVRVPRLLGAPSTDCSSQIRRAREKKKENPYRPVGRTPERPSPEAAKPNWASPLPDLENPNTSHVGVAGSARTPENVLAFAFREQIQPMRERKMGENGNERNKDTRSAAHGKRAIDSEFTQSTNTARKTTKAINFNFLVTSVLLVLLLSRERKE
jgi:hypothetical protein